MTPQVRSVTVRLNAQVAGYMRDMKAAGAATDDAFGRAHRQIGRVDDDVKSTSTSMRGLGRDVDRTSVSFARAEAQVTRYNRRMRALVDTALILGPSLVPIGAVGIPAVTGLANQLGAAAAAAGVAVFAFQGVGDALSAVNTAALDPTAENLEAAREAMAKLTPEGRRLVSTLSNLQPVIDELRATGQAEMFPGLVEGLEDLVTLAPQVDRIIGELAGAMGDIAAEAGDSLASERWLDFFTFLGDEARPTLEDLSSTIGSVAHGLSEMWMAFQPLNRDFGDWLRDVADDFDDWASGLARTDGFRDFVDYIRANGPQVADTFGAIGNAIVQIVEATAPVGEAVLPALEAFADVVATIADSDLGTPILAGAAALAAYNRALAVTVGLHTKLAASRGAGGGAGFVGGGRGGGRGGVPGGWLGVATGVGLAAWAGNSLGEWTQDQLGWKDRGDFRSSQAEVEAERAEGEARRLAQAQKELAETGATAAEAQARLSQEMFDTADIGALSSRELGQLNDLLGQHTTLTLGAFSAETQWRAAMRAAAEQAKQSSAGIRGNSDAALANRSALEQLAASWNGLSEATRDNVGRQKHARRQFIETATAMGVPKQRARELANELLDIPDRVKPEVDVDDKKAKNKANALDTLMDDLGAKNPTPTADLNDQATPGINSANNLLDYFDGRVAHATVVVTRDIRVGSTAGTAANPTLNADGGLHVNGVRQFADGGYGTDGRYYSRDSQIVPGGTNILWGEKETGWEAYISGKPGQRDRNLAVLSEAASRLGATVETYANGGSIGIDRIRTLADRGRLNKLDRLEIPIRRLEKALGRSEDALRREREERDRVRDQMRDIRSTVRGRLRSDVFDTGGDPWTDTHLGGSFGDVLGGLRSDIREGRQFRSAVRSLRRRGVLSDPALQALIEEGDPAAFDDLSNQQLRTYDRLYRRRQRVTADAGRVAGNAVLGDELRTQTREAKQANRQLNRIEKTIKHEHREDRRAARRGASDAVRGRRN